MPISGVSVGAVAMMGGGLLFLWSGYHGAHVTGSLRDLLAGKQPQPSPDLAIGGLPSLGNGGSSDGSGVAASGGSAQGGTDSQNQALGKMMASAYGWGSGDQWTALNNVVMAESGWSSTVTNPGSGAAGIAQKISGFGPGYERGNASQQIAWLLSYIKSRYGDPVRAWQFHLANGWY